MHVRLNSVTAVAFGVVFVIFGIGLRGRDALGDIERARTRAEQPGRLKRLWLVDVWLREHGWLFLVVCGIGLLALGAMGVVPDDASQGSLQEQDSR